MSAIGFQLVDDEKIDDSIIKRALIKRNHQLGANVNSEKSNIKLLSVENHNFIQVGIGYLEFDIKIRKGNNDNFSVTAPRHDIFRLVNNAFAYTVHDAGISTSTGVEIEQNKFVGPVSTIMRLVTQTDGDLSSHFDIIDESKAGIDIFSLKQALIDDHTADKRGIIRSHLPFENTFGFCKSFKQTNKGLGFELDLRTSNRKRDIFYTILGDEDVNVTINNISLLVPQIIPSPETQVHFNEDISNLFTLSYEPGTTDQKPVDTAKDFRIVFSSTTSFKSPLHLIAAHHLTERPDPADPIA